MKRVPAVDLPLIVVGLSPEGKRRQFARLATSRAERFDLYEAKSRLEEIRGYTLSNVGLLRQQFLSTLSRYGDVHTFDADEAETAAAYVAQVAGSRKAIAVNRASVIGELKPWLEKSGYTLVDTYLNQFDQHQLAQKELIHYWQLPAVSKESAWESFAVDSNASGPRRGGQARKDYVALLGVSAAAAEDGSIYFLQHSSNIGLALQEAGTLVLVVAVDKVVSNKDDALFQTKCMGIFGMESIVLDLKAADQSGHKADLEAPKMENRPCVTHIILLDNGRGRIISSDFRDILACIGCRACLVRCPTHDYFGASSSNYPKQYLWSFLTGSNRSLELCIGCGACRTVCPLDINIPQLMSVARGKRLSRFARLTTDGITANVGPLMHAASWFALIVNLFLRSRSAAFLIERIGLGISPGVLSSLKAHRKTFAQVHSSRKSQD